MALVGDLYLNRRLGLAFTKPAGWVFEEVSKLAAVAKGRVIDPALGDLNLPIVTVAAPLRGDGVDRIGDQEVRPIITVHLEGVVPYAARPPHGSFSLLEHVAEDLEHFASLLGDFFLESGPRETPVSQCPGVEYRAKYLYFHEDFPEAVPMRERALIVLRMPAIYGIRMCDFPDRDERLRFDFDEFASSISLA